MTARRVILGRGRPFFLVCICACLSILLLYTQLRAVKLPGATPRGRLAELKRANKVSLLEAKDIPVALGTEAASSLAKDVIAAHKVTNPTVHKLTPRLSRLHLKLTAAPLVPLAKCACACVTGGCVQQKLLPLLHEGNVWGLRVEGTTVKSQGGGKCRCGGPPHGLQQW